MDFDARGTPAHTRTLVVDVTRSSSGGLEARGHLVDLRKRGLVAMAAGLQPAGIVHDMYVTAEVESGEPARLRDVRADQPGVAFEPSPETGGESCRDPADRLAALAGRRLDDGAAGHLRTASGGPRGCSHVLTLAQLVLSTARTALDLERERYGAAARPTGQRVFHRSLSIDGLVDGERLHLLTHLADLHLAPIEAQGDTAPFARLGQRLELRVAARVELSGTRLGALTVFERRSDPTDYPGKWRDRSARVAELVGSPAGAGMARRVMEALGPAEADRPLLDALLNLAPALIQCAPALSDEGESRGDFGLTPLTVSHGMPDSCYMWRSEGALARRRNRSSLQS